MIKAGDYAMKRKKEQTDSQTVKPVCFTLNERIKKQLYEIATFLHGDRTHAIKKILDMLFTELENDQEFLNFIKAYDPLAPAVKGKLATGTFYIPVDYLERFDTTKYKLGFIERSPFIRLLIDFVYNTIVSPASKETIPKIVEKIEGTGLTVLDIYPILEGDIYVHLENPDHPAPPKRGRPPKRPWD